MSRHLRTNVALLLIGLVAATGCHPTQPFYFHEDGDLDKYLGEQLEVGYPDVYEESLSDVKHARSPHTLTKPFDGEIWDLTLEECVSLALNNSKIIRTGNRGATISSQQDISRINSVGSVEGNLIQNFPASESGHATIYNPAIVESNPGVTNAASFSDGGVAGVRQGVEAALSAFDAQLNVFAGGSPGSAALIDKTDRARNVPNAGNPFQTQAFQANNGALEANITKFNAMGGTTIFRSRTNYSENNIPAGGLNVGRAVASDWTQVFEMEWRQPLLRGRGAQVNRMPVMIARIGTDRELIFLEKQLQNLVMNVEIQYWELECAYRLLETNKIGRDNAHALWKILAPQTGITKNLDEVARAQEQYFSFKARTEQALRLLYDSETDLRLLMGIGPNDGRLIRPIDKPTLAKVEFDWLPIMHEALVRRPELRNQKWIIKQRELELILARNQMLPQLNARMLYRWVGVGDNLISADRNGLNFPAVGSTAFDELTEGRYQEALFGFDFSLPVGFRQALAGIQHAQLRLLRSKAFLEDNELDVVAGLSRAVRNLDTAYELAGSQFNRWNSASEEVDALEAQAEGGVLPVDRVLDAQLRRTTGQAEYYRAICEYNKAIAYVHLVKGSILDYSSIHFAEGPWPKKAYWDALGRARERDASMYLDYGWTRPGVISRGPLPQHGGEVHVEGEEVETPAPTPAEPVPTPAAERNELPEPPGEGSTASTAPAAEPRLIAVGATAGAQPASKSPAKPKKTPGYDWGGLGLKGQATESAGPRNVLRQASFEEESLRP